MYNFELLSMEYISLFIVCVCVGVCVYMWCVWECVCGVLVCVVCVCVCGVYVCVCLRWCVSA